AALLRASVACLHHAGPAAGDNGPAGFREAFADRARGLVGRASVRHARRPEQRDGRPVDLGHLLEPRPELGRDLRHRLVDLGGAEVEDPAVVGQETRLRGTYDAIIPTASATAVAA